MQPKIPSARHIDARHLALIVGMPLVAAIFIATGVQATSPGDVVAEAGGPVAFVLDFAIFCYLAVAAAHLASGLTERTVGGVADLDGGQFAREAHRGNRAGGPAFWHTFPNHFDGSAIAAAITILLAMIQ